MIDFDLWYDEKVKEIEKRLPDPNTWQFTKIIFPVNFTELYSFETGPCSSDTLKLHTIDFEKKYINKKYVWKRIVY